MKVESEEWEMKMGVVIVYAEPSYHGTSSLPPPQTLSSTRRVDLVPCSRPPPPVNSLSSHKSNDVKLANYLEHFIYENKCQSGTPARISIHLHHHFRHPTHQAIYPSSPSNSFISVKNVMHFGVISVSASKSPVTFVQTVSLTSLAPT